MELHSLAVVLVEPSFTQQRIISDQLKNLGILIIDTVTTGTDALQKILNEDPDLVISSMHLPDMTGSELVVRMRQHDNMKNIAFMLISSETHYRYLEPIRQAGAIAILPKPFETEDLRTAISATLDYINPHSLDLPGYDPDSVKILMVDDSAFSRNFIRRVLNDFGLTDIIEVTDGKSALACMEDNFFDLVITDYNMPKMDGKELIVHIRESSSQPSIPILMVTSEQDQSRLASVQKVGVSAIWIKPFDTSLVKRLIEQILSES